MSNFKQLNQILKQVERGEISAEQAEVLILRNNNINIKNICFNVFCPNQQLGMNICSGDYSSCEPPKKKLNLSEK